MNALRSQFKSNLWLPFVFGSAFFVLNVGIPGPAYLSDEIGYLDKAASLSGSIVHYATSWYGGYSLLLSPAFFLSSQPVWEWRLVLLLNALMWAGTTALLRYVLLRTHPKLSPRALTGAIIGAMLYPAWLSMSGYAFSTSGFVLVFMGSIAALLKSEVEGGWWLRLSVVLAAYLCWIHPLGFVYFGLLTAVLAIKSVAERTLQPAVFAIGGLLFAASYSLIVAPWFSRLMSGSAGNDQHYGLGLAGTLHAFGTPHFWLQALLALLGLALFVVVASFGLVVYGAAPTVKTTWQDRRQWRTWLSDAPQLVRFLVILSPLAVLCLTAVAWGSTSQLRIDQWVYGRYSDMYILPLLGFGLLSMWRLRQAAVLAVGAAIIGILLQLGTNTTNTAFIFNNKVNIQSFWPMHVASVAHLNYYWLWGLLGAAGILFVGLLGSPKRKIWLTVLLVPVVLSGISNYLYHSTIMEHATVSTLSSYITHTYKPNDCIGFTAGADPDERFNLYSYYLHGYNVTKQSLGDWQKRGCRAGYLTYAPGEAATAGLHQVGSEPASGLYLFSAKPTNSLPLKFR